MSFPEQVTANLRFFGDNLDPEDVSLRLGQQPTKSARQGDVHIGKPTGQKQVAKTGSWRLSVSDRSNGDFDMLVSELLEPLTKDLGVWKKLTTEFHSDLFCGVFMKTGNDMLSLRPETLQLISERGLGVVLDIYDYTED